MVPGKHREVVVEAHVPALSRPELRQLFERESAGGERRGELDVNVGLEVEGRRLGVEVVSQQPDPFARVFGRHRPRHFVGQPEHAVGNIPQPRARIALAMASAVGRLDRDHVVARVLREVLQGALRHQLSQRRVAETELLPLPLRPAGFFVFDQGEVLRMFLEHLSVARDDRLPGVAGADLQRGGHAVVPRPGAILIVRRPVKEPPAVPDPAGEVGGPRRLVHVHTKARAVWHDRPLRGREEPAATLRLQKTESRVGGSEVGGAQQKEPLRLGADDQGLAPVVATANLKKATEFRVRKLRERPQDDPARAVAHLDWKRGAGHLVEKCGEFAGDLLALPARPWPRSRSGRAAFPSWARKKALAGNSGGRAPPYRRGQAKVDEGCPLGPDLVRGAWFRRVCPLHRQPPRFPDRALRP